MGVSISGALSCVCETVKFFFLPTKQHCFIQDPLLGFIAPGAYCMYLSCLRRGSFSGYGSFFFANPTTLHVIVFPLFDSFKKTYLQNILYCKLKMFINLNNAIHYIQYKQ